MRGAVAKRIRRAIYGDHSIRPEARTYAVFGAGESLRVRTASGKKLFGSYLRAGGRRLVYQATKRSYYKRRREGRLGLPRDFGRRQSGGQPRA